MYYTGLDPRTLEPVYVATNPHEKAMQRALIQYKNPKNYDLVYEALTKAHREDLIGFDAKCLIRPRRFGANTSKDDRQKNSNVKQFKGRVQKDKPQKKKTIRNVHKKK